MLVFTVLCHLSPFFLTFTFYQQTCNATFQFSKYMCYCAVQWQLYVMLTCECIIQTRNRFINKLVRFHHTLRLHKDFFVLIWWLFSSVFLSTAASLYNGIFPASQTAVHELSGSVGPRPVPRQHTWSTDLQHHRMEQVSCMQTKPHSSLAWFVCSTWGSDCDVKGKAEVFTPS